MELHEMIVAAQERQNAKRAAYEAEQMAKMNEQIAQWRRDLQKTITYAIGADLLSTLNPQWVGGLEGWRSVAARFAHGGVVYEISLTEQPHSNHLIIRRVDSVDFDNQLRPEQPSGFRDFWCEVQFVGVDGYRVDDVSERADMFLVALADLAARPKEFEVSDDY